MSLGIGSRVYFVGQAEYPHGTVIGIQEGYADQQLQVHWDASPALASEVGWYLENELREELANKIPGGQPSVWEVRS